VYVAKYAGLGMSVVAITLAARETATKTLKTVTATRRGRAERLTAHQDVASSSRGQRR
jgi:hypothetical protein